MHWPPLYDTRGVLTAVGDWSIGALAVDRGPSHTRRPMTAMAAQPATSTASITQRLTGGSQAAWTRFVQGPLAPLMYRCVLTANATTCMVAATASNAATVF